MPNTTTEGMTPEMARAVQAVIRESGGKVWIKSGFRTRAEQEYFYQEYLAGRGNLAAKPGTSRHEHGNAVDFGGDLALAKQLASKYGLSATVPGEPWHFSIGGAEGSGSSGVGETIGGEGNVTTAVAGDNNGDGVAPLPANATPEQIDAYIRENFPQAAGFLDIPEIRTKLIEAAQNEWTPTKLQAEMQATTWWRTNGAAARNFFALKGTDPAQIESLISAKLAELGPEIAQLGLNLGGPEGQKKWAENAIKYGWTSDQLRQKLAAHMSGQSQRTGLTEGGNVDLTADGLMQLARTEYFVPISRQDAERWAIDIYAGRKTEDTMRNYFGRLAASRFPGLEDSGFTPGEYMAPVRNLIAETLELNPADVDLLDRRWAEVLETQTKDGTFRPMTLGEAGRWARGRQEYQTTTGARDEAASMAETLARTFGAVG